MAIIDQRILIPARQEIVWAYLSDLSRNADWQADCLSVSFLSTKHDGVGTRWRVGGDKGKDAVYEITSWYNGLGYEYIIVDGTAYKDNKGRLRLQEIPEGTVVQWTFSFEGGGLLGGGKVRQLDAMMAASLKALYKQLKSANQNEALVARSLMRDAPDVEARAAYKPRHSPALTEGAPAEVTEDAVLLPTPEPALKAEDAAFVIAVDLAAEPPVAVDDTRPRPPVTDEPDENARFAPPAPDKPVASPEVAAEEAPESVVATLEPAKAAPVPVPPAIEPEPPADAAGPGPDRTAAAVAAAAAAAQLPPPDPAGKSIWEIFGVQRPGEGLAAAATISSVPPPPAEPIAVTPDGAAEIADNEEAVVAPPPTPDPQETAPLEMIAAPTAVVIPPVVLETVAAVETVDEIEAVETAALPPAGAFLIPASGSPPVRRGLRLVERRGLVKLRRPN